MKTEWRPEDKQVQLAKRLQRVFGLFDHCMTDVREVAGIIAEYFPKEEKEDGFKTPETT